MRTEGDLITIADLDRWGACDREPGERYDDDHLAELLDGRDGWTIRETAALPIPAADRV
jgi:hypothetical protein